MEKCVCVWAGGVVSGLVGRAERAVGGIPGGLPAGGVKGMSTWAKQQNNEEPRAVNKDISCGLCFPASCGHCQPNWGEAGSLTRFLRVPKSSKAPAGSRVRSTEPARDHVLCASLSLPLPQGCGTQVGAGGPLVPREEPEGGGEGVDGVLALRPEPCRQRGGWRKAGGGEI